MKRWLWFCGFLAAVCLLSRLPHPAVDVGELEPVAVVMVDWYDGRYHLKTDTQAQGSGETLEEAAQALAAESSGIVFLETAECVLLTPRIPVTEELYRVFRPACRVCLADTDTDPAKAAEYLAAHPPEQRLTDLWAGGRTPSWLEMEEQTDEGT